MGDNEVLEVAVEVDRLVLESRFRDLALVAQADRRDRVGSIAAVLAELDIGAYLIGCGPYSCGIFPLTVDEVVLGRPPSPLEALPDSVADYTLNDAVWMQPREASRIHASILRQSTAGRAKYWIRDENSKTGTYVNSRRVGVDADGTVSGVPTELAHGDVVSLGPSGVNSYIFYVAE